MKITESYQCAECGSLYVMYAWLGVVHPHIDDAIECPNGGWVCGACRPDHEAACGACLAQAHEDYMTEQAVEEWKERGWE